MSKLRVHSLAMSLDGYVAGPDQSVEEPLGVGGEALHDWMFETRHWHRRIGEPGGTTGVDDRALDASFEGIGAWIMGRNMFGPVRGEWHDVDGEEWRGWWGDEPPYHCDVYVLTHHAREPFETQGGTTFHFVTDGIESALEQAFAAADGADVRLGGGAATVREYLRAGLIDELHLPVVPRLLGAGEPLLADLGDAVERYECVEVVPGEGATHFHLARR
jgi:dihydrofolate reductase